DRWVNDTLLSISVLRCISQRGCHAHNLRCVAGKMPARAARESGAPTGASPRVVLPIRGGDTRQALSSTIRALGIDAHYRTLSYIWHHRPSTVGSRSNEIFSALRDADNGLWSFAFSPWFPP